MNAHIPFFRQRTGAYCGPAVMQMILRTHGMKATQDALAREAKTVHETGTSIANVVKTLRKHGFTVDAAHGRSVADLKRALIRGWIVIVCFTERASDEGHYAIVLGFKGKHIVLHDPAQHLGKHAPFTIKEFETRWKDRLFTRSRRWAAFVAPLSSGRARTK